MNCQYCKSVCVKIGRQKNGTQKYRCKECKKYQQENYTYNACVLHNKKLITSMVVNNAGFAGISRILHISKNTVSKHVIAEGNNYSYTEIGELESDFQEDIEKIIWRVDGKVSEVIRPVGNSKKNLKFEYDAMGNRIAKHIYSSSNNWEKSTFYVRDAQGNVISVYEETNPSTPSMKLIEQHIYGSSRLGMNTQEKEMIAAVVIPNEHQRELGKKQFELSNHLGNVLEVITDKKLPIENTTITGEVDYFISEIISATDYSGFGVRLEKRSFNSSAYRYSFQNQEHDDAMKGEGNSINFEYRMHDPRLGRFFTVDPLASSYAHNSTYAFSENRVIDGVDLEGLEYGYYINV